MVNRLQYLRFCLFKMYVNVVFVIRCLYSAVSLTLVREQLFMYKYIILIIYYYYYALVRTDRNRLWSHSNAT